MANIKVSELSETTTFNDDDYTMIVQNNQNKKISKENMLNDINTAIGNLSNLETNDKTNIVNAINELKNREVYSTDEIKTNKVWLNGKPIYRKIYTFTIQTNDNLYIARILDNADVYWINESLSFLFLNGESISFNFYYSPTDWGRVWLNSTNIRAKLGSGVSAGERTAYVAVEYTKTTD